MTTFSHSQQFRNQYQSLGLHYFQNGQQRSLLAGNVKLDADANYTSRFRASTGRSFNWSHFNSKTMATQGLNAGLTFDLRAIVNAETLVF